MLESVESKAQKVTNFVEIQQERAFLNEVSTDFKAIESEIYDYAF